MDAAVDVPRDRCTPVEMALYYLTQEMDHVYLKIR